MTNINLKESFLLYLWQRGKVECCSYY